MLYIVKRTTTEIQLIDTSLKDRKTIINSAKLNDNWQSMEKNYTTHTASRFQRLLNPQVSLEFANRHSRVTSNT